MRKYERQELLSSNRKDSFGLTLIELLVTLVILSILAAAALPYAEITIRRSNEIELKRTLREIRTAIDQLHEDWKSGEVSKADSDISQDGYPKTLLVMVEGVDAGKPDAAKRKYLRRIPDDPFGDPEMPPAEQWVLRSYRDEPDTYSWGGEDVYDIKTGSDKIAINGSAYKDW